MTEDEVRLATCQVLGLGETGTGWLVSADHVLTAYHCLGEIVVKGTSIEVSFGIGPLASKHSTVVDAFDEELDVCLLRLANASERRPVPVHADTVRPGEQWRAFGFPVAKLLIGGVLSGTVQQSLTELANGVDLDLSVSPETALSDYRGLSGAALITAHGCQGMLRVSVDNSLGAVSMECMRRFLTENNLLPEEKTVEDGTQPFALRPAFDEVFESTLIQASGGYLFLDGAHGIGKSTYCRGFIPNAETVETLGVYAFTERSHGFTPSLQAQPEVFVDWLTTLVSTRATGKPARLTDRTYAQLIQATHQALGELASRCASRGRVGFLFLDGVNEVAALGGDTLERFVGLLPSTIPAGLKVVVVGAGLDAIANRLGPLLQGAERMTLPALEDDIQYRLCVRSLDEDKATPSLVSALCERAKGHPLYLRYLVDLVNGGADVNDLEALPPFSGLIEDYYERIWSGLLVDTDAINLLGIIARLRWGIPTGDLMGMLSASESAAFVPTITRIRHLLSAPSTTEVYHSSFSDFIVQKTSTQSDWIQGRLSDYCVQPGSGEYGELNRVFHGLLSRTEKQLTAIAECQQRWVDRCVLLGAEPDVLLGDIEDSLNAAIQVGTATDIVRLLLLSQRLKFRYDTLFAQSASLAAEALIALGKTEQALRHILRHGQLIVGPREAFSIVRRLIEAGHPEEGIRVLRKVDTLLHSTLTRDNVKLTEYFDAASIRLQGYALAVHAGAETSRDEFLEYLVRLLRDPRNNISREDGQRLLTDLIGNMLGTAVCVTHTYKPLAKLPIPPGTPDKYQALSLLSVLRYAHIHARHYDVRLPKDKLGMLLEDIGGKVDDTLTPDEKEFGFVDLLIEACASPTLVERYAKGLEWEAGALPLYTENKSLADSRAFIEAYSHLRAAYFLNRHQVIPSPAPLEPHEWEERLDTLARSVVWLDAKARHAYASNDQQGLAAAKAYLTEEVLPCFKFQLASRVQWPVAYFVPENIVPILYGYLTDVCLDCLPGEIGDLVDVIEQAFEYQLGLYNEGFRCSLQSVMMILVNAGVSGDLEDRVFELLLRWRNYVRDNVQNRHELVPELLSMVPLLARMGSPDEALRTYESVLAVSMGPSWYKEDQFSVMSRVLEALPFDAGVASTSLAQIAALLERASGEMTFQRYVRADKGTFIGELSRRGLYSQAVRYFQHQACGTLDEMRVQASDGDLDRVAPLVGMRYPGGQLEEQASLNNLLKHIGSKADWRVRWALLEVYQHGDERHLRDWGPAYAALIQEVSGNPTDLAWTIQRIDRIAQAMNPERAWMLLRYLSDALPHSLLGHFSALLEQYREFFSPRALEDLGRRFGMSDKVSTTGSAKSEASKDPDAAKDAEKKEKEEEGPEDQQVLPGTFGTNVSVRKAEEALEAARRHIKRKNMSAAIEQAVLALRAVQDGGWSIWSHGHPARMADLVISQNVASADELARLYGPLALREQHTQSWSIAYQLIELVGPKLDSNQRAQLLSVATDHVRELIGDAPLEKFEYIGSMESTEASDALLDLLLWALDHPSWERRDSAAAMVLWLLRSDEKWIPRLAPLAFSMEMGTCADIAAGSLDILSRESPQALWERIVPFVSAEQVSQTCSHSGRYATLLRIADRAASKGVASATEAASLLRAKRVVPATQDSATEEPLQPHQVPSTLHGALRELYAAGLLDEGVFSRAGSVLRTMCGQHSFADVRQLETLAAERYREPDVVPDRWAARVRYALNVALFAPATIEQIGKIEAALRIYNPASLIEPLDGKLLISSLIAAIESGKERSYVPSSGDLVFLDLQCYLERGFQPIKVDLTSHLLPPGQLTPQQGQLGVFKPTELPRPGSSDQLTVCSRVKTGFAHFGALTPAIASPRFIQFLQTPASSMVRHHWRDGSTARSRATSRRHEVSMLAIRREALVLPPGWRMQWILRVNGTVRAVLHKDK